MYEFLQLSTIIEYVFINGLMFSYAFPSDFTESYNVPHVITKLMCQLMCQVFLAVKSHVLEPIPLRARTPSASNINIKFPKDAVRDTHCTYSHLLKYMYSMSTAVKWWKWSNIKKLGSKLKMDVQSQKLKL